MNSQFLKKIASLAISGLVATSLLVGCGPDKPGTDPTSAPDPTSAGTQTENTKKPEDFSGTVTFWHFNDDEASVIKEAFEAVYKNVTVDLQVTADTDGAYQTLMTNTLRSGSGVPDVYALEAAFVKRFVNIPNALKDLSAAPFDAESLKDKLVSYTVDIGRSDDGKIRALSHQACPGAVGYKRDLAKEYLGTDDPTEISAMLSTPEKMLETARKLKTESDGKVKMFAGMADVLEIYLGARSKGWVVDGKLVIDPKIEDYVKIMKTMTDEGLHGNLPAWEPPWSAAIEDDEHFAYAIPTWGIPWIIRVNQAEDKRDKGDWALAEGPYRYTWGGTWYGMYSDTENEELAWELVKFITADDKHLEAWGRDTGDIVSNLSVIDKIAADSSFVDKTVNQNTYEFFKPLLAGIDGSLITEYDDVIKSAFQDAMMTYLAGNTTEDQMWAQFKDQVRSDLDELEVE